VFINNLVQAYHMVTKIITEEGEEKRVYVCPYCGQVFETQNGYAGHIKRHYKRRKQNAAAQQQTQHYYQTQWQQQQQYYQQLYYHQPQHYPQQYYQPTWADIVMPTSYQRTQPQIENNQRRENGVPWWVIIGVIGAIVLLAFIVYEEHKKEKEERKMLYEMIKNYSSDIEKLRGFLSSIVPKLGLNVNEEEEGE